MRISEIMSRDVLTTTPEATLKEGLELLARGRLNGLVVVDGGNVAGVVTKADIFRAILPTQTDIAEDELYMQDLEFIEERIFKCLETRIGKIMATPPVTLSGNIPMVKAGTTMLLQKIKQIPIVEGGKLVGVVTLSDILSALLKKSEGFGKL